MIPIENKEFEMLTGYLQQNFGINLTKKRTLIESRLNNHLMSKGFGDYGSFLSHVLADETGREISDVLNRLTTNYSYFMREWEHFEFFRDRVLPELKNSVSDRDLRVWSAGCSTGQEPYTLAMLVADFFGDQKKRWDSKILATDISEKALDTAKQGRYDQEALKGMPPVWRFTYFNKTSDGKFEIKPEIKDEVIYRRFNLIEDTFPFKKKFHVVFCRNVMIYFSSQTKKELVEKLYEATAEGGYLFVGQSETLDKTRIRYKAIMPSVYRKGV